MLGRVRLHGFRNDETYFLICSSPLRVQLTMVAERHLQRQQEVSDNTLTSNTLKGHKYVLKIKVTAN